MLGKRISLESHIFTLVLIMSFVGLLAVYSASSFKAELDHGASDYYLLQNLYRIAAGLVVFVIATRISYKTWLRLSPFVLAICLVALVYLLVATDVAEIRGSKRWLSVWKLRLQPSDLSRIAMILFLSLSLGSRNLRGRREAKGFYLHLALIGLIALLVFKQPDVGSAAILVCIAVAMLFVAGERLRYLASIALIALPALLWFVYRSDGYQKVRIVDFYEAFMGGQVPWQVDQSLIAFGVGRFLGTGIGGSTQKYGFLPDAHTDFVYAIIGEEFGLAGTLFIVILFALLLWTGFRIMSAVSDVRAKLLTFGIVFGIALYAIINAGVVLNLLPTTGIPMPFLSYGGSAMLTNMFGMGVLVNISAQIQEERKRSPLLTRYQMRTLAKRR
jgi:cell division protein FtsW